MTDYYKPTKTIDIKKLVDMANRLDEVLDNRPIDSLEPFIRESLLRYRAEIIREIRFIDLCALKNQQIREETNE